MAKYSLVGKYTDKPDLMRYTSRALRKEGLEHLEKEMFDELICCDYFSSIAICEKYIQKANEVAEKKLRR